MSKADAKEAVFKYLVTQNRPYSANDVTQNMHKEFGKTAIQKALEELATLGRIKEKIYGKQKVYAPIQDENDQGNMDAELLQLDVAIKEVTGELATNEQKLKAMEAELKSLSNKMSTEEAKKLESSLTEEVAKLREKLASLKETTVKVEPEEKKQITKENEKITTEYRKRKRICMDIANTILENYPKPKKTFFEEVGIETDEDVAR